MKSDTINFYLFPLALLHIYVILNVAFFILSFKLITTTRSLVLCAESRREMEDWLTALKAASLREYYEPGLTDTQDFLSNHHHWYVLIKIMSNDVHRSIELIMNINFIHLTGIFIFIIALLIAMCAEI